MLNLYAMLNSNQILKYKMYTEILELCDTNKRRINFSSQFNDSFLMFKMKMDDINEMLELATIVKNKHQDRKDVSKKRLCNVASEIKGMLSGKFTSFSQKALKIKIAECFVELYASEDCILEKKIEKIYAEAHLKIDDLLKFGITAPLIEVLKEMLIEYQDTFYQKNFDAVNKTLLINIKTLFWEADYLLRKELDRYVSRLGRANSSFVVEYRETRLLQYESVQVA